MKTTTNKYQEQANTFAAKYGLTMEAQYIGHFDRFGNGLIPAVYDITLVRPNRKPMNFRFSTSLNDSYYYMEAGSSNTNKGLPRKIDAGKWCANGCCLQTGNYTIYQNKTATPSLYDILACLTKYDPETFEDFCGECGYNTDSRRAYDEFLAVDNEWHGVKQLFSDCLDELSEIQ